MQALLSAHHLFLPPRLKDISLQLQRGEVVGLLGINGAGKSSLLAALAGVLPLQGGSLQVQGRQLHQQPQLRRQIGWLPQHPPVYPDMTVQENLHFHAALRKCRPSAIEASFEQFALGNLRRRLAAKLSGGEQMRLGLACCLVHQPDILLLDEPTAGLDALQADHLHQLIRELAPQRGVIIASHLLPDIEALCQRALLLDAGSIVAQEPVQSDPRRMLAEFSHPPSDASLLAIPGVERIGPRDGMRVVLEVSRDAPPVMPEKLACHGWGLRRWQPAEDTLLQRFRALSSGDHA